MGFFKINNEINIPIITIRNDKMSNKNDLKVGEMKDKGIIRDFIK